ncbi:MAG: caspase family protein [Pseudomonadota bacterium]
MTAATNNPNKRALIVGINKYPKLEARYQLNGCVNDAKLVAQVLQDKFEFPEYNVTVLLDEDASRENIMNGMQRLVSESDQDDIVFMYYSGHGSRRRARRPTKPSGKDATIIASDSGRGDDPNLDIIDDEIHAWLGDLSQVTSYITLLFDCCHSGTISRDVFGDTARWVEEDDRSLEEMGIPVDDDVSSRALDESDQSGKGPSGWLAISESHVLMAGCRDEELSYEYSQNVGGQRVKHGGLTFFLCQELLRAESGMTYRDVFERARLNVTSIQPKQHPQIEGKVDREVLGIADIKPMRFLPVTQVKDGKITLGGGAAHGLAIGSEWGIYSQGTKAVDEEQTGRIGFISIESVGPLTSVGQLVDNTDDIQEGCRAVEEKQAIPPLTLVVDLNQIPNDYAEQRDWLKEEIEQHSLLALSAESQADDADLRVYIIAPRDEVGADGLVPQLEVVTEPTWVVVDRGGQLAMPPRGLGPDALTIIPDNLLKQARYRNALHLKNSSVSSKLSSAVTCKLRRKDKSGEWVEALPDEKTGQVIFEEEEMFSFEITNNHDHPVFVSILDFGVTGSISLLHPYEKASDRYETGVTTCLFDREEDAMDLYLPETLQTNEGVETFKLFVTTAETDFSWMAQEGMRSGDLSGRASPISAIEEVFAMAYEGTRETRRRKGPKADEWFTIEKEVVLRRKANLDAS